MASRPRAPGELLPLPVHLLHILLSLLEGERHGYAVLKEIEERTAGETRLGASTLYAALKRMVDAGLAVETAPPEDADSSDSRRRYYRATAFGAEVARAEAQRIRRLSRLLDRVPALSSGAGR